MIVIKIKAALDAVFNHIGIEDKMVEFKFIYA